MRAKVILTFLGGVDLYLDSIVRQSHLLLRLGVVHLRAFYPLQALVCCTLTVLLEQAHRHRRGHVERLDGSCGLRDSDARGGKLL